VTFHAVREPCAAKVACTVLRGPCCREAVGLPSRGSSRFGLSVAASFVWRCPNILALTPFPHPAHRTQRADLPHWTLGQDITPSHTPGYAPTGAQTYETEIPVEVRGRIGPAPATSELVLVA
jgi:hypothetical protein